MLPKCSVYLIHYKVFSYLILVSEINWAAFPEQFILILFSICVYCFRHFIFFILNHPWQYCLNQFILITSRMFYESFALHFTAIPFPYVSGGFLMVQSSCVGNVSIAVHLVNIICGEPQTLVISIFYAVYDPFRAEKNPWEITEVRVRALGSMCFQVTY